VRIDLDGQSEGWPEQDSLRRSLRDQQVVGLDSAGTTHLCRKGHDASVGDSAGGFLEATNRRNAEILQCQKITGTSTCFSEEDLQSVRSGTTASMLREANAGFFVYNLFITVARFFQND
jgi:hypothetical protein